MQTEAQNAARPPPRPFRRRTRAGRAEVQTGTRQQEVCVGNVAARRLSRGRARGVDRSAAAQGCRPFCKKAWRKNYKVPRRDRPVCCGAGVRASTSGILLPKAKRPAAPGRIHATRGRNRVGEASAAGTGGAADAVGWCRKQGQGCCGAAIVAGSCKRRGQERCGAGLSAFLQKGLAKKLQSAAAGKGSRHTGPSIGSVQCTRADCLFW